MSQRISKYHLDVLILLLSIWSQVPLIIHLSLDNNLLVLPRSTISSILNSRLDGQMDHQVNSPSFNSRFPVILFKMCTNVEKSELKTENAENNWQIVERETDLTFQVQDPLRASVSISHILWLSWNIS